MDNIHAGKETPVTVEKKPLVLVLSHIQDGSFWDCSHFGGELKDLPSLKFVTYPTIVKLYTALPYLKKIEKYINHVIHPLSSDAIMIFSQEIRNFGISRNTDKYCICIQKF